MAITLAHCPTNKECDVSLAQQLTRIGTATLATIVALAGVRGADDATDEQGD
jgi:hypothetical protein